MDRVLHRRNLQKLYRGVDGFLISRGEERKVNRSKGSPTYGEIMPSATFKMLEAMDLDSNDVFFDLGCGVGKVVLAAAMATSAKRCVGVELSSTRFGLAEAALLKGVSAGMLQKSKVELRNEDILKSDLHDASAIFLCATAFKYSFTLKILERLRELKRDLKIVSTQQLDEPWLGEEQVMRLDFSWLRNGSAYFYRPVETEVASAIS